MFGLSFGEVLIILVVALMVLGPSGMPKLARTLGKGLRDFRRATGELRGAFEDEFYQLDKSIELQPQKPAGHAPAGATPVVAASSEASVPAAVGAVPMATGAEPDPDPIGTSGGPLVVAAAETVAVQGAPVPDAEATPVVNPPVVKEGREG